MPILPFNKHFTKHSFCIRAKQGHGRQDTQMGCFDQMGTPRAMHLQETCPRPHASQQKARNIQKSQSFSPTLGPPPFLQGLLECRWLLRISINAQLTLNPSRNISGEQHVQVMVCHPTSPLLWLLPFTFAQMIRFAQSFVNSI